MKKLNIGKTLYTGDFLVYNFIKISWQLQDNDSKCAQKENGCCKVLYFMFLKKKDN